MIKKALFLLFSFAAISQASVIVNPGGGSADPDSLNKSSASMSYVGISSLTASHGVLSVSSGSVSFASISSVTLNPFVSTFSATDLNGFKLYASSGQIAASTSLTISIPGISQIWFPVVSELETVNTAVISVRIKSITSSDFVIYNADAINAKNYIYHVLGK